MAVLVSFEADLSQATSTTQKTGIFHTSRPVLVARTVEFDLLELWLEFLTAHHDSDLGTQRAPGFESHPAPQIKEQVWCEECTNNCLEDAV